MSELRCPEECGGCPKCMGPAIELVEATERDEWKARAERMGSELLEAMARAEKAEATIAAALMVLDNDRMLMQNRAFSARALIAARGYGAA